MAILVSDANIFIDMHVGELMRPMFRLDDPFAAPDVLYREELEEHHAELPALGLQIEKLGSAGVAEVQRLTGIYRGPSTNDLFAIALAGEREWPLLSADGRVREAAIAEGVEVHGTCWLVERMVASRTISAKTAQRSFGLMKDSGRRLPWSEVERRLDRLLNEEWIPRQRAGSG